MNKPSLSLIVVVYNKAENLKLIFAACARQSFQDFEIIIADDGSGPEIRNVIEEAKKQYHFPIQHLWHKDIAWRKNVMLNNAIRASCAEYLVFIDGDCIPHKDFLLDHWSHREEATVVGGRRVTMSERWSKKISSEIIASGQFEKVGVREWFDAILGRAQSVEEGLRFKGSFLQSIFHQQDRQMLGCNFSISKKYLEAINGFDECYDGPGCGEDTDIEYRLSLIGVKSKTIRHQAILFHIHHPVTKTSEKSFERFRIVGEKNEARCEQGLDQHSEEKVHGYKKEI